ncbi:MAG: hypothetical protein KGK30_08755, partial [Elusimicrobia bacterium]|nr:hypothetical protein [Elusimicrobiota bacterium]
KPTNLLFCLTLLAAALPAAATTPAMKAATTATTAPDNTFDGSAKTQGSPAVVPGSGKTKQETAVKTEKPGPQTVQNGKVPPVTAKPQAKPEKKPASKKPASHHDYAKAIALAGVGWVAAGMLMAVLGFDLPLVIGVGLLGAAAGAAAGLFL